MRQTFWRLQVNGVPCPAVARQLCGRGVPPLLPPLSQVIAVHVERPEHVRLAGARRGGSALRKESLPRLLDVCFESVFNETVEESEEHFFVACLVLHATSSPQSHPNQPSLNQKGASDDEDMSLLHQQVFVDKGVCLGAAMMSAVCANFSIFFIEASNFDTADSRSRSK